MTFIENLKKELETQDNYATQHPFYLVQEEEMFFGVDTGYTDDYAWVDNFDSDIFYFTELEAYRSYIDNDNFTEENFNNISLDEQDKFEEYYTKFGYIKKWETVSYHLTEKSAKQYIENRSYKRKKLRIWVVSLHDSKELALLINMIRINEIS